LAAGVETRDKRDMHGLLYRIFAALKFDGAKFGESPTLTMQSPFLDNRSRRTSNFEELKGYLSVNDRECRPKR
jgi:hypothetical protein